MSDSYKSKSKGREILLGASLGPVFASCSPIYFFILANILPTDKITGLIYLIFYTAGLGIALYIVSILGDKLLSKTNTIMSPTGTFMKTIGVIILIVGIAIITGYDKKVELYLTSIGYNPANIENKLLKLSQNENKDMLNTNQNNLTDCDTDSITDENAGELLTCLVTAPEFVLPDGYVNTNNQPIKLSDYKGKIVLLEFWTYSCINCQHVIPYLNS
ncbi:MAG: redoxin domain-containing protein [Candidatus Pacebacteria bacterium]|nr:redoxin domain-containing protein [Candidatus Paceibacterota bacterium]